MVRSCNRRISRFSKMPISLVVLFVLLQQAPVATAQSSREIRPAITLHPDNPHYFLFRDKPLVLITATEHYGAVLNRPFDYKKYLDDMVRQRMTLTRTFVLYRELQTPRNPYSTCKPETLDYIAPWPRKGPGSALDASLKYDLDSWNPEFFRRLRDFLQEASIRGIVVELTLFSCSYNDQRWALNPLRSENNLQGIGNVAFQDYISLRDKALVERQIALTRKVVQETCQFDNLYYETCNEPIGGFSGHATRAEVDAWQETIARTIREELRKHDRSHLVFGYHAASTVPVLELDESFDGTLFDGVNMHPSGGAPVAFRNKQYRLGRMLSGDMTLREKKAFHRAVLAAPKPCVDDEDNAASSLLNEQGWTVQRKRAWVTVMSGGHYDMIDFSIIPGRETGTPEAQRLLRTRLRHLSTLIHSFDFIHAQPLDDWVAGVPEPVIVCTLAVEGKDYVAYLADARESTSDPNAGKPIEFDAQLDLPPGRFIVKLYSPGTGHYSPGIRVEGGKPVKLHIGPFTHDIVIRANRVSSRTP